MQHVLNDMVRELERRKRGKNAINGVEIDDDNDEGIVRQKGGEISLNGNNDVVSDNGSDSAELGSQLVKNPRKIVWKLIGLNDTKTKHSRAQDNKEKLSRSHIEDSAKVSQNVVTNDGVNDLELDKTEGFIRSSYKDILDQKASDKNEYNHFGLGIAGETKRIIRENENKMCQNVISIDQSTGFDEQDNVTKVDINKLVNKESRNVAGSNSDISLSMRGIDSQSHCDNTNENINRKNSERDVQCTEYSQIIKTKVTSSSSNLNDNGTYKAVDNIKKQIDGTKVENNSKCLDFLKKRNGSFQGVDDLTVYVDSSCRNVSTKNDATVVRNNAYCTKYNALKDIRDTISRSIDRNLKYRYVVATENFWNSREVHNPTYYQKYDGITVASINIDSDTTMNNVNKSNKDTDNQTISDLINNLKVCNIHNENHSKETKIYYENPNDTNCNQATDSSHNLNECPNSVFLNRLKTKATEQSEVENHSKSTTNIFHRSNQKDFDNKQVFKPKTGVRNEQSNDNKDGIENMPHTSKSASDFVANPFDSKPKSSIKSNESRVFDHNQRFQTKDINKENVADNVKGYEDKVVKMDDSKHIRSAVLLRRVSNKT